MTGRPFSFTVEEIEQALRDNRGMITHAADQLECTPRTVHNYISKNPKLRTVIKELRERLTDRAEIELVKLIEEGDGPTVRWYLAQQGVARGYGNRLEIQGDHAGDRRVTITLVEPDGASQEISPETEVPRLSKENRNVSPETVIIDQVDEPCNG